MAGPGGRVDAWPGIPGQPERGCVRGGGEEISEGHVWDKVSVLLVTKSKCVWPFALESMVLLAGDGLLVNFGMGA